jgi:hypothetical protein
MDSLQDILAKYGQPEEPELLAVKRYVDEHYHIPVSTALQGEAIIVTVPSAALANTLRLQISRIRTECGLTKRLIFRIG